MSAAEPERQARNEISGSVTGPVAQVGVVQGDLHIHPAHAAAAISVTGHPSLLDEAIGVARSITNEYRRADILAAIAGTVAELDPDRVEGLARLIPASFRWQKVAALTDMIKPLALLDTDRAQRLATEAERLLSHQDGDLDALYLAKLATAMAETDTGRAMRLAAEAEDRLNPWPSSLLEGCHSRTLAEAARAVATLDRSRAEHLLARAEHLLAERRDRHWDAAMLAEAAIAAGHVVPLRGDRLAAEAEYLAREQGGHYSGTPALEEVARVMAPGFAYRAERILAELIDGPGKARILAALATEAATRDPARARALITEAEAMARSISEEEPYLAALSDIAKAAAAVDPAHAAHLAQSLPSSGKAPVLAALAAATSPARPS